MNVLVINTGSSSCKVQLIDPAVQEPAATAVVERLGSDTATYRVHVGSSGIPGATRVTHVAAALDLVLAQFARLGLDLAEKPPAAIGHRVVHGGPSLTRSARIDARVVAAIESAAMFAPAHTAASLEGITAARRLFPDVPQVAVFDTAFFASLPAAASTYAIDWKVAAQNDIRRYGFHGISHEYVSAEAARWLGRDLTQLRQIVLHLGNGASVSAVDRGRPVDTSMGMTPLEGLVMGTRAGDIDPGVLLHLIRTAGLSADDLQVLLGERSGLVGLTGRSDMRDVVEAAGRGDCAAQLALDVVGHRLRKYIGAYAAILGGIDVLTFTAGVGENSADVRARAVAGLDFLGIRLDTTRNTANSSGARLISADGSRVAVLVIPTNEELGIARHAVEVIERDCQDLGPCRRPGPNG